MNIGFPDVCNTPVGPAVVPIPYPNFALNALASAFSFIVKVTKIPGLNLASKISMTFGDEPGVAHPTVKGTGAYTMGNPKVLIEKLPGIMLTAPTTGNSMNNPVGMVAVPSAVNVLYTLRRDVGSAPAEAEVTPTATRPLQHLAPRLSGPPIARAERRPGAVGWLEVALFSRDLPAAMFTALRRLERGGPLARIVLDLRGCPGGELLAMVELCDEFLPRGAPIVEVCDGHGETTTHRARHDHRYLQPLTLLVDGGTASAAELFAACLQRHGRAQVAGERTYGKNTAQCVVPTAHGPRYETVAVCTVAGGHPLASGVEPDVFAKEVTP